MNYLANETVDVETVFVVVIVFVVIRRKKASEKY